MEFENFVQRLRQNISADLPESLSPNDGLYDELGLDSFQAFELLIIVESLAGSLVPPVDIPELYTVGDAYAYYRKLRSNESHMFDEQQG